MKRVSIETITSEQDIRSFFLQLSISGIVLNPDEDIYDYFAIRSFELGVSLEETIRLSVLMDDCFEFCDKNDIDMDLLISKIFVEK